MCQDSNGGQTRISPPGRPCVLRAPGEDCANIQIGKANMLKYVARIASVSLTALLLATAANAAAAPAVKKVKFTGTAGAYGATLSGTAFGTAPAGVPCTACAIPEFSLVASKSIATGLTYGITAWTNTKITLTAINGSAGDAVFAIVKNDALKNVATWGGNFPGGKGNPVVKSVAFSGSGKNLKVTVTGSGFGAAPSGVPGTGDIPYLNYLEWNIKSPGQDNYPWAAGWEAQGITDTVTLKYTSWSDTQIVASGFAGAYGTDGFVSQKHDPYLLLLWSPPGTDPGSTGPQTAIGGRLP